MNQGTLVTVAFTVVQDVDCNYPLTYTQTYKKAGLTILTPSWISFDNATRMYMITITATADVAVYTITSTATIPQNAQSSNTVLSTS